MEKSTASVSQSSNSSVSGSDDGNKQISSTVTTSPSRLSQLRHGSLTVYRRLFSIVTIANLSVFVAMMCRHRKELDCIDAAAVNLLVSGLARQPMIVNAMIFVVCSVPVSAPLRLRRLAAKVSHYGGVHSGCGVASMVWYVAFVAMISRTYVTSAPLERPSPATITLSYLVLFLLLSMIIVSYPTLRAKYHDIFELTHRFSSWLIIALFWPLILLTAFDRKNTQQSASNFLLHLPAFWCLILTTLSLLHPWLLLRRIPCTPEAISTHAIRLHFSHRYHRWGQGFQIARHPLRDWHGFATIPAEPARAEAGYHAPKGFSCLVSKVGDWTTECIKNPPTHVWVRGMPILGFGYGLKLFHRVILVATGSGIGPCLSFLSFANRPPIRLIWQTRSPLTTYGPKVLEMASNLDKDPVIIDTSKSGKRQDMLPVILSAVEAFEAEAVFIVSNKPFTQRLVSGLQERGVGAYGALFDS